MLKQRREMHIDENLPVQPKEGSWNAARWKSNVQKIRIFQAKSL